MSELYKASEAQSTANRATQSTIQRDRLNAPTDDYPFEWSSFISPIKSGSNAAADLPNE